MNHATDLMPGHVRPLWEAAARFVAFVLTQFGRERIRTGIRRATGARISIWLADAESALRRMILIAALGLAPMPSRPRQQKSPSPRAASAPQRGFRIFRLHGSGQGPGTGRAPPHTALHTPAPYGHIRFPADPILALGRLPARRPRHRHNGGPRLPRPRARNPLDRWVRLSRNDPDWRPPPESFNAMFDYNIIREPLAENEDAPKRKRKPLQRLDSQADWRRHHDEWQRLVPAPVLAARLDALERLMANPEPCIRRTARRLQSQRERTLSLARTATPRTTPPRRARDIETAQGNLCHDAHRMLAACDSS